MKDLRDGILAVLKRFIVAVISTLGVVTLFGFILEKMEALVNTKLYSTLGRGTVLFTAAIGTPLHEIAHWLGCKLFGFKVYEVELLRPKQYRYDGILGYVSYSYDHNSLWQKFGCFFVGIAPMIMGVIFILLFTWLLKPEIYSEIRSRVDKATGKEKKSNYFAIGWAVFSGFWKGLFSLKSWGWLRGILFLYIVMSISMHMTISPADIEGATAGIWIVLAVYGIFAVITAMIGNDYVIPGAKTAAIFSAFFSIGLITDAFLLALALLFGGVGNFKGIGDKVHLDFWNTVNLNSYVTVTVEGYDHYGTLKVEFDSEKFLKKYGDKINKSYNDALSEKIGGGKKGELVKQLLGSDGIDIASYITMMIVAPSPDKKYDLSNGDVVNISWGDWNSFIDLDEYLEMSTGLRFKHKDFKYKAKGLEASEIADEGGK